MLFCTFFFCRHYTTTTGKCLIARFMEDVNKRRRIFLSRFKLKFVPQEINSWKMTVERVCLFHGLLFQLMPGPFYAPPIAAIKSKQFENYLSEMKASCNTKATDHGGPKLENNCRFFGSKAKSSAVDGKTKVVKQAHKFQGEAIFFSSRLSRKMPRGTVNEVRIVKAKVKYG